MLDNQNQEIVDLDANLYIDQDVVKEECELHKLNKNHLINLILLASFYS